MTAKAATNIGQPLSGVDIVDVVRIDTNPTAVDWMKQSLVTATTRDAEKRLVQYSTVNNYLAAQCDWGLQSQWPLVVTWRLNAYGREIVSVGKANL